MEEHELPPPRLLKIDVQGFEGHVVAGATETLERTRYCITEVSFKPLYEGAPLFDEIYDAFVGRGFRLAGLAGELRSSTGEQPCRHRRARL